MLSRDQMLANLMRYEMEWFLSNGSISDIDDMIHYFSCLLTTYTDREIQETHRIKFELENENA